MNFIIKKQNKIALTATNLQLNVSDPTNSVWVSASAGTGKTHVLIQRILRLLLNDPFLKISEVLAITFTKAATMEMQSRLIEELSKWIKTPQEELEKDITFLLQRKPTKKELINARTLLTKVLDDPVGLNISTVHSFCETLLRKFPIEAGIPSSFVLIEGRDEKALLKKAWFKAVKELSKSNRGLFNDVFSLLGEFSLEKAIQAILSGDNKNRFYKMLNHFGGIENFIHNLENEFGITDDSEQDLKFSILNFSDDKKLNLKELLNLAMHDKSAKSQKSAEKLDNILSSDVINNNLVNEYISIFFTKKLEPQKAPFVKAITSSTSFDMEQFIAFENNLIIHRLESITNLQSFKISKALSILADKMFSIYKKEKLELALLDFNDLIEYSEKLVNKSEVQEWITYKLDSKIKHCLLDEAQDTDNSQWNILSTIVSEFYYGKGQHETPRTTFAVGDMKQSIYRFRGANPEVFNNIRKELDEKSAAINHSFKEIGLHTSFRSTKAILNFVDEVFKDKNRKLALDGIDEELTHEVFKLDTAGRVEISPIITKDMLENEELETSYVIPKDKQIEKLSMTLRRLNYKNVANKIVNLFNTEDVSPQDIIILLRNRAGMKELTEELTKANIPHTGSDILYLSKSVIVEDLLNFAKFICFEDDLSLISILKSPSFNYSDDVIFKIYTSYKKEKCFKNLFHYLSESIEYSAEYSVLREITKLKNRTRIVDLYTHIINKLDLNEKFMALSAENIPAEQQQVKETIQEFLNQVEKFPQLSVLSFLNWFKKESITVKKNTSNIKNAVRIMTCHGSKGLEAKIVFLPDCGSDYIAESISKEKLLFRKSNNDDFDSSFVFLSGAREMNKTSLEKEILTEQEDLFFKDDMRLLYVALTRAAQGLYISGVQNKKELPENSWYSLLHSIMNQKINEDTENYSELTNGALVFKTPQLSEIQKKEVEIVKTIDEMEIPQWIYENAENEQSVQQERSSTDLSSEEYLEKFKEDKGKDLSYGSVVHKLLEELPKLSKDMREEYLTNYLNNKRGLFSRETLTQNILSILDKFDYLFTPNSSFSEVQVQYQSDKLISSGIIDRIAIVENKVYIIDYKTGQKTEENLAKYTKQLQSYVTIVKGIYPAKQIIPAILWISSGELDELN
ncbi:MAG: UvrD-helicase domain-containing protein [Proteobacteria bacterium]|nr:UvrD-helicase domain-containing protein [Pseudomonadota bacterium]